MRLQHLTTSGYQPILHILSPHLQGSSAHDTGPDGVSCCDSHLNLLGDVWSVARGKHDLNICDRQRLSGRSGVHDRSKSYTPPLPGEWPRQAWPRHI